MKENKLKMVFTGAADEK